MEIGQLRQGDVLLIPVAGILPPASVKPQQLVILAVGESTGHAHRLRGAEVYDWEVAGQRYVRVEGTEPGTQQHEEHDPVPAAVVVPRVTYEVVQQQEMDLSGQWRKVQD